MSEREKRPEQLVMRALGVIRRAQKALGPLSEGQLIDLLLDNLPLRDSAAAREVISRLNLLAASHKRYEYRMKKNPIGAPYTMKMRRITQDDINAAARGLKMAGMSYAELTALMNDFKSSPHFAGRNIYAAAKQMRAAKSRTGLIRKNPVARSGLTLRAYVNRKSQITKKRPTKRLKKRRAIAPRRKYFPNPKKIATYTAQIRQPSGAWKTVASYDSGKRSDPRGLAISAARIFARVNGVKARVIKD